MHVPVIFVLYKSFIYRVFHCIKSSFLFVYNTCINPFSRFVATLTANIFHNNGLFFLLILRKLYWFDIGIFNVFISIKQWYMFSVKWKIRICELTIGNYCPFASARFFNLYISCHTNLFYWNLISMSSFK